MRPKSYVQKKLLNEVFAPLPAKVLDWAQKKMFAPYAQTYVTASGKTRVTWCMECGHIERAANVLPNNPEFMDGWTCPSCHCHVHCTDLLNTLTPKAVTQGCISQSKYITVLDVRHEWQVFRCFEIRRERYAGGNIEYSCPELFRIFINSKGVEHIVSSDYVRTPFSFHWLDTWSLKNHNGGGNGYYMFDDLYNLKGIAIAPGGRVLPDFKKMGLSASVLRNTPYDPARLCLCVARYPQAETLFKSRQKALLKDILSCGKKSRVLQYWPSIKIALRHGYKPLTKMPGILTMLPA